MGRTLPTFNTFLEAEYDSWRPYRRALRREDQEAFDALFRAAKQHVAESSHAVRAVPFEAMLISMLVEHEKELRKLRGEREPGVRTGTPRTPEGKSSG
jgi:hypothetical protein